MTFLKFQFSVVNFGLPKFIFDLNVDSGEYCRRLFALWLFMSHYVMLSIFSLCRFSLL